MTRKWSEIRRSKGAAETGAATARLAEAEQLWKDMVAMFDPPLTDAQERVLMNILDAYFDGAVEGARDALSAMQAVRRRLGRNEE